MTERFTIQHVLTEHATGQLARATDSRTGLPAVIREFRCASEDERVSLESLMMTLAELRHANLEPVHEVIRDGQNLIIVTEAPEGETIAEVLEQGPLSLDEFRPVATQLLGALSAAHQRGAVHGSIHAGRIRIQKNTGPQWKAQITGYGIGFGDARPDDSSCFLCVPPEQWEQLPARRRSDVYALGCVLYQALAGRSPFDGKTLKEIRHKHVKHDLRPLDQVAPQAPPWVCKWVMSLLEPDPEKRPESATAALDRYRTAEASRNTVSIPLSAAMPQSGAQIPASTGFVRVAGSAFFRVPNVMTQTVGVKPIDPMIHAARQTARQILRTPAPLKPAAAAAPGKKRAPTQAQTARSSGAGARQAPSAPLGSNWLAIGGAAAAVMVIGIIAVKMQSKNEPAKVVELPKVSGPIKVTGNPSAKGSSDLPPVTSGYPTGRQKPVNYPKLVFHAMADGGIISTRTDAGGKRQNANVNDEVFAWRDFAERARDSGVSFPANQGSEFPKLVSMKPDVTFPLARERRFIRFSGEGSPSGALTSNAKNQIKEFPFAQAASPSARGLTFAIVFFQVVKGRQQTLFHFSSSQGSTVLRLGEKGEVRLQCRKSGIPDSDQAPTLSIGADKFNPSDALLVTGVWSAEPAQIQLRLRSASGYTQQVSTPKAPTPKDALGNLLLGRENLPGPTSTNKSTDAASLRAFAGGIAEVLIYAGPLNEGELKSLEAQIADVYFPKPKS